MKKLLSIVIAVMAAMCCLGLTACGSSLAGTYKLESVTTNGNIAYAKSSDSSDFDSKTDFTPDSMVFTLTDDTFTFSVGTDETSGSYEKSGALLTFRAENGDVFTATLTGNFFQTSFKDKLDRNNCWTFNLSR